MIYNIIKDYKMSSLVNNYLLIGLGLWLGQSARTYSRFKNSTILSWVRGVALGVFLWPIALIVLHLIGNEEDQDQKDLKYACSFYAEGNTDQGEKARFALNGFKDHKEETDLTEDYPV